MLLNELIDRSDVLIQKLNVDKEKALDNNEKGECARQIRMLELCIEQRFACMFPDEGWAGKSTLAYDMYIREWGEL